MQEQDRDFGSHPLCNGINGGLSTIDKKYRDFIARSSKCEYKVIIKERKSRKYKLHTL